MTRYVYFITYTPFAQTGSNLSFETTDLYRSAPITAWGDITEVTRWLCEREGRRVGLIAFSLLRAEDVPADQFANPNAPTVPANG